MNILTQIAVIFLGLTSGAMLLIGVALAPGWQSMDPTEFTQYFAANAPLIGGMMMPISVTGVLVTLLTTGLAVYKKSPNVVWLAVASICSICMVILFPLYFKDTNAALVTDGALTPAEITEELIVWHRMHLIRMISGIVAFVCLLRASHIK